MKLGRKEVGHNYPTYFIADIGSNHDGSYERAERLIYLAQEAGADAVKFQNFRAESIVSDYGFQSMGKLSHQSGWDGSVFEVYKRYETPLEWTPGLKKAADTVEIDYLTTPYNPNFLNYLAEYVCAWKIGSGDITYDGLINALKGFNKPIILGTGASTLEDVERALVWLSGEDLVVMQCNTDYTTDEGKFEYVNLRVIEMLRQYPFIVGLSDHTYGHAAVLGAVALGARVIEKHFTDDNLRQGPDHSFAMNPISFRDMVTQTRHLESSLGHTRKVVEDNERETYMLQRRAVRAKHDIPAGKPLEASDFEMLRPCPLDALPPYRLKEALGGWYLGRDLKAGDYIRAPEVELKPGKSLEQ